MYIVNGDVCVTVFTWDEIISRRGTGKLQQQNLVEGHYCVPRIVLVNTLTLDVIAHHFCCLITQCPVNMYSYIYVLCSVQRVY